MIPLTNYGLKWYVHVACLFYGLIFSMVGKIFNLYPDGTLFYFISMCDLYQLRKTW